MIDMLLLAVSGSIGAAEPKDSTVLERVFSYQRMVQKMYGDTLGFNVYHRRYYDIKRRNFTLWLIPSMYTVAKGDHKFLCEDYGRVYLHGNEKLRSQSQLRYTTIPRNRGTMDVLNSFLMPSVYNTTVYGNYILSPFCRENRRHYRYKFLPSSDTQVVMGFTPRFVKHTQLVKGLAIVEKSTGRILAVSMEGSFDLLKFSSQINLNQSANATLIPRYSRMDTDFKFLGNHITSSFTSMYDCPKRLPDSLHIEGFRPLLDSVRPLGLRIEEKAVYDHYDSAHAFTIDTTQIKLDSLPPKKTNFWKDVVWGGLGEHLVRSHWVANQNYYAKISPILQPQYVSYSASRGLSYKMKVNGFYLFSPKVYLSLNAQIGYNFKNNQLYMHIPLILNYDTKHQGRVTLSIGNGNKIGSTGVVDDMTSDPEVAQKLYNLNMHLFKDNYAMLTNTIWPNKRIGIEAGLIYHRRRAVNPVAMRFFQLPTEYLSIAPSVRLYLYPIEKGPMLMVNYERGVKASKEKSYIEYERWESDATFKYDLGGLQTINARVGGGFYTKRHRNLFMDFSNFHVNYLPGGWDDDWSGDFQLLLPNLYNESRFYLRSNVSYESPLLITSLVPFFGRNIERERFYWSGLIIEHSHPYQELGYSFSCQYFSMGFFVNFLDFKYQKFGTKFTFELFRRW